MKITLPDRIRARAQQMGMNIKQVAQQADVNRSFINDILRGRSERPNLENLGKVATVLHVDHNWLLHGMGDVEGEPPFIEDIHDPFVKVPSVMVKASMGGGAVVEDFVENGKPYHFRRSWITNNLRSKPSSLRILHVEGDSMAPSLLDGDTVLVDLDHKSPTPPGIFVLFDGQGLVAKRLDYLPNSSPPAVRIISDNRFYSPYERTTDEINIIGRIRWFAREI